MIHNLYSIRVRPAVLPFFLLLFFLLLFSTACGEQSSGEEAAVVATVNDQTISETEWLDRIKDQAGREILDTMIDEALILQAAEDHEIEVTDADIMARLQEIKSGFPSDDAYEQALAQSGLSEEQLENELRLSIIVNELSVIDVDLSEEEIRNYFEENRERFGEPRQIQVRHILVETLEEAEELRQRILDEENFEELAAEHSLDEGTAEDGGLFPDYFTTTTTQLDPAFRDAAFGLTEVGELTEPVQSQFGYHLIRLNDVRPAVEPEFEAVRDEVEEVLMSERGTAPAMVIQELRQQAEIDVRWDDYGE